MQGTLRKDAILIIGCIGIMLWFTLESPPPRSPAIYAGLLAISIAIRIIYRDYNEKQNRASASPE